MRGKFEKRLFKWRMNDPGLRNECAKRAPFVPLATKVRLNLARARKRGVALHGPNKHGRHFWPLSTETLDARRQGIDPRVLAGRGQSRQIRKENW